MSLAIPKLTDSDAYNAWRAGIDDYIRSRKKKGLAFLLEPGVTTEDAEEAYINKGLELLIAKNEATASPASPASPEGDDGRPARTSSTVPSASPAGNVGRSLRSSSIVPSASVPIPAPIAVPNDAPTRTIDLVRMRLDRENVFEEEMEKMRSLLVQSVDHQFLLDLSDRSDAKKMLDEIQELFKPDPGEEQARLGTSYRAMMREASIKGIHDWIGVWGDVLLTHIRAKSALVSTNTWKVELAEKLGDLANGHQNAQGLKVVAILLQTEAQQSYAAATTKDVRQMVKRIRTAAADLPATAAGKGKRNTAFATTFDIAEDKFDAVEPSSRPERESRPRGDRKRAVSPSTYHDGRRSRPNRSGPHRNRPAYGGEAETCEACGGFGHQLEACFFLFRPQLNEQRQNTADAVKAFVERKPALKQRYEAVKANKGINDYEARG
ncbi:hypothetical protein SEPCBS119000_006749 [Sporothrix epigloea]|uniref:Gag protein n=1 Tax=Sporothrix epigloea TaxID=1892477 RepID=A0ABP0E4Q0_9PEZI